MYKISANTAFIGQKYTYLPICRSTNDIAADYIQQGIATNGHVIATSNQTDGRGQRGNSWESHPDQNLTFSVILQPSFLDAAKQFWLNMAISLSILDVLSRTFPTAPWRIKWPNDLFANQKKIGGILIENYIKQQKIEHSIIGVGLNINQDTFSSPFASSLKVLSNKQYVLSILLESILESLETRYTQLENHEFERLRIDYLKVLLGYHELREFEDMATGNISQKFTGQILGIDEHGKLAVEINGRVRYFGFKEIKFIF